MGQVGALYASAQPWVVINLPPRASNDERFGSIESISGEAMESTFDDESWTPTPVRIRHLAKRCIANGDAGTTVANVASLVEHGSGGPAQSGTELRASLQRLEHSLNRGLGVAKEGRDRGPRC